jgi:high-affinity nickel permease
VTALCFALPRTVGFALLHPQPGTDRLLLVIGLGLVLGMRHSTDADHIVALSTIVSKQRSIRRAAWIGSLWGLGHTATVFAVGCAIILFHVHIPVRLGLLMEFSVAVMLVLLGILNLTGVLPSLFRRFAVSSEQHDHSATGHVHRAFRPFRHSVENIGLFHTLRPVMIGLVHGLAGSAAVALLVLATIQDPLWAVVYLLVFGAGTMLGMMLMTTLFAIPLTYGSRRFARLNQSLAWISGAISLCFGAVLMYQLGFVDGLFTSHPQWTPQ